MRYYSVREAKWITLGAQAKKPGTKGADGKKHGGVAVLIGDDGVILKGPKHMQGKKPDELGGRQKTLGEKPGEKQEPRKYQNLAFGPDGEIAEPDAPKSPPPGTGYADLRAAAAQPAPEPTPAPAPAPAKPVKPVKVPKVAKPVAKPEPVAAPTPEPKPKKGETVRAKIARIKAEKEKRYNDTLKKRGKKEADKQKADDKRQAKAEKDALNPAQAEARKKKQVERISKINAARPESLISLVRKEGGISGGDYDYATDIKEFGLKSAMNKRGLKIDDMAKSLQNAGHLVVPEGKKAEDVLLAGLQARANSALHNHTGRYNSEYDDFVNNREDADNAPGADSDRTASVISRGEEAGTDQGDDDSLAQILGLEPNRSDADEPEPSDYGHPDDYEPSDYEPEEGDLGDGGETTGADTSFDFGAPEPEPAPAPAPSPASPPVDMFGNATTTAKKQPDMMTDMFGARIQAEAPKVTAAPTVADDAAKSLDWLDKNDPKKDGSAEMFGSLFSPGASGASAKTQPEAPGEGFADLRAAATQIKEPQRGWTSERQDFHRTGIGGVNTHAGKTPDGAAEFDELKNKLGADSGEIASVNLGELYKKHLDAAMQQGGVDKEAFDSAMGEGPTGKNYSRLTALNGEAARRTRAELKEKTGPYIAHNTDGAIAAGYHANPADMVPGATDTDYRRSSAAIITGPETQAKNYKAIYGKPAKAGPALAEPLFGNQPAPAPTPATAPEPGAGYDDLRAASEKKPLPPTPPAGLADRIAKRGTPTTIGPAKPVDTTDYNDPKEKARIAAFISRDLSGAASPKAAAKKLVRDLPFLSPEKFRARLDAVKSEFPEIYQAFKEDPGIAGPDAHAEIAAHTGGEPPKEFPGAAPSRIPGEGFADLRAAAAKDPEVSPPVPPAPPEAPATPEAPTSLKVTKGIGYHRQGKTAAPAYLAKISGTHNGKTFNREFQDGDEDTEAKQAAYRKKKGTYSETHDINDGELYEHSQDGDRKLFAVLPSADGKKRREKVSYEMPEISEASRIMGKTKGGASAGTGRGEDIDIPELLAHQHKMALKAGSYKGLTLPDVARDLMASRGGQGEPEPTATPAPAPAPTPEPGAGYAELRAAAAAEPEKTPEPTPPAPPKMSPGEKKRQQAEEFEAEKRVLAVLKNNSATHAELRKYTASSKSFDPENPLENPAHAAVDRLLKTGRLVSSGGESPTFSIKSSTPTPATPPPPQKPIDLPPKTPDTTSPGATTAPEPEKSKVEHFSVTASGRGFSQAIALLKKRGGKFNPATKTWAVPTGKVTANDASSFGLQQKAFPQAVRSKRDEDNFGNEDEPERYRVYR